MMIAVILGTICLLFGCGKAKADMCPYEIAEDAVRTDFVGDNIAGLDWYTAETNETDQIFVLAFSYLGEQSTFSDTIISEPDGIIGLCPYGYFYFDETDVKKEKGHYYIKLRCDKRITVTNISFDKGDERVNINFKEGMELSYCDFRNPDLTKRIYQSYDGAAGVWDEKIYSEEEETWDGIEYYSWEEMAVGYDVPCEIDGVTICVYDYNYFAETYNIYGEIENEKIVSFDFFLKGEAVTDDETEPFHIYKRVGDEYVDITPADVVLSFTYTEDEAGNTLNVNMKTNQLDEMEEGDYRICYGSCQADFTLTIQSYEVW